MCFELAFSLLILPQNKNLNYKQITSHGRTPSESLMIGFTILILFHVYLLLGIFSSSLAVLYVIGLKSLSEIAGTFPTEKHVKKLKKTFALIALMPYQDYFEIKCNTEPDTSDNKKAIEVMHKRKAVEIFFIQY